MDRGEIRRFDPEALVYMLMGMLDFIGMRWVLWDGAMPPERVLDDLLAFMRHGLQPGPDDGPADAG